MGQELELDGWIVGTQDESGKVSLRSRQTGQRVAVSAEPLVLALSGSVALSISHVIRIYSSRARRLCMLEAILPGSSRMHQHCLRTPHLPLLVADTCCLAHDLFPKNVVQDTCGTHSARRILRLHLESASEAVKTLCQEAKAHSTTMRAREWRLLNVWHWVSLILLPGYGRTRYVLSGKASSPTKTCGIAIPLVDPVGQLSGDRPRLPFSRLCPRPRVRANIPASQSRPALPTNFFQLSYCHLNLRLPQDHREALFGRDAL